MKLDGFELKTQEIVGRGQAVAFRNGQTELEVEHLVLAILDARDNPLLPIFEKFQVSLNFFKLLLNEALKDLPKKKIAKKELIEPSNRLKKVFDVASQEAVILKADFVSIRHLIIAIACEVDGATARIFETFNLDAKKLTRFLLEEKAGGRPPEAEKFPILSQFSRDISRLARLGELDPVIGRDPEIDRVLQVLGRRAKNNPVLIGPAGVGKTAIFEGLVQRIVSGQVPVNLRNKQCYALDIASVLAGAGAKGVVEERIKAILKEIADSDNQIVLFIDELHTIVGAGGGGGSLDISNLLKPALARGQLRCIGATTVDEYRKYIEKDKALERRFQQILVEEPSAEKAEAMLRGLREKYEIFHGLIITDEAIKTAVKLADRYIPYRSFPDKAVDIIDEACSRVKNMAESLPADLQKVEEELKELHLDREMLRHEEGHDNAPKIKEIEVHIAKIKEENKKLVEKWRQERELVRQLRQLRIKIWQAKLESHSAARKQEQEKAMEMVFNVLTELLKEYNRTMEEFKQAQGKNPLIRIEVLADDVAEGVSRWTGIPVTRLMAEETKKLKEIENCLQKRVVGQEEAVGLVSAAVRRARTGFQDPNRPIGSFIFLGPTGVGKTELAKTLAEFLFDDEEALVRVDMSEYMEKHNVARLIGAPPGYIGYEEGGQLTEAVRHKPYCVVLLDEVEKAHQDVFNVLLQVLDEGHITDGQGNKINFKNTILILTSNLGSEYTSQLPEKGYDWVKGKIMEELKKYFRLEFINRLDDIVLFNPMTPQMIEKIVDIQFNRIQKIIKGSDYELDIELTPAGRQFLAEVGFDQVFGARPLKRILQKELQDELAVKVIAGEIKKGASVKIEADAKNKKLAFLHQK